MIYFVSSGKSPTGGPTLMHQGCKELLLQGFSSKMLYTDIKTLDELNPKFFQYDLEAIFEFESILVNDTVIIPEQYSLIKTLTAIKCKKIIWWLSVDNFIVSYGLNGFLGKVRKAIIMLKSGRFKDLDYISNLTLKNDRIMHEIRKNFDNHWAQSHYAIQFLKNHSIKAQFVGDYLTDEFFDKTQINPNRENIVAYNPRKGYNYVLKIKKDNPQISFVPIEKLTPKGVKDLLNRSKIYVDFGNHPGQDRIPREAAMSGCLIIVGMRGSASNDKDVPINKKYKIDLNNFNSQKIGHMMIEMMQNYDKTLDEFNKYRQFIMKHNESFKIDIYNAIKT
jgi:hypothetical protein